MYKLPVAVLKEFEKVQRRFLWGWGDEGRKVAWVSWRKVCEPREAGGLGILNLRFFNAALLGKWIWRLETEKDGLWKEILEYKYGGWRNLQEQRSNAKDSSWWRDWKGVWGWRIGVNHLRIVASGEWKTGRIFYFAKMFGWATKI